MKNRIRNRVVLSLTSIGLLMLVLVILGPTPKSANAIPNVPTPPFTQCPPIGLSASCGVLIEFTDTGTNIFVDPAVPPFDGIEDTLVGVLNDSSATVPNVTLAGTGVTGIPIFGLDGDGLCVAVGGGVPPPAGCPFGPTGYEGPGTSFSAISPDMTTGTVNFTGGLAPGASGYFSLEDKLVGSSFTTPTPIPASPTPTPTPTPTATVAPQEAYVTASKSSVKKGQQAAFIVALDPGPAVVPVTVNYSMSGSAILGSDYSLSGAPGQVTIPAGQSFAKVILRPLRSVKKNATMTLTPGPGYFLSGLADDVSNIRIQKK